MWLRCVVDGCGQLDGCGWFWCVCSFGMSVVLGGVWSEGCGWLRGVDGYGVCGWLWSLCGWRGMGGHRGVTSRRCGWLREIMRK